MSTITKRTKPVRKPAPKKIPRKASPVKTKKDIDFNITLDIKFNVGDFVINNTRNNSIGVISSVRFLIEGEIPCQENKYNKRIYYVVTYPSGNTRNYSEDEIKRVNREEMVEWLLQPFKELQKIATDTQVTVTPMIKPNYEILE